MRIPDRLCTRRCISLGVARFLRVSCVTMQVFTSDLVSLDPSWVLLRRDTPFRALLRHRFCNTRRELVGYSDLACSCSLFWSYFVAFFSFRVKPELEKEAP